MQSSSCSGKWSLPVMLIVDLSNARVVYTALTFPVLCLAYTRVVYGAVRAYAHAHDDHYLTRSNFNSLLTEMITPQTYIYIIIIKPLPVSRVFGARSGSPRIIIIYCMKPYKIKGFCSVINSILLNSSSIFSKVNTELLL